MNDINQSRVHSRRNLTRSTMKQLFRLPLPKGHHHRHFCLLDGIWGECRLWDGVTLQTIEFFLNASILPRTQIKIRIHQTTNMTLIVGLEGVDVFAGVVFRAFAQREGVLALCALVEVSPLQLILTLQSDLLITLNSIQILRGLKILLPRQRLF